MGQLSELIRFENIFYLSENAQKPTYKVTKYKADSNAHGKSFYLKENDDSEIFAFLHYYCLRHFPNTHCITVILCTSSRIASNSAHK